MLHTAADLDRIKKNVNEGLEPWAGAWKEFQKNRFLAKDFPTPALGNRGTRRGQRRHE